MALTHVQSKYTVHYDEGAKVGYKWYESEHKQPLFPFGFGLSYTTYAYSNLKTDNAQRTVSFAVKNTGKRAGAEIAQVYADTPGGCRRTIQTAGGMAAHRTCPRRVQDRDRCRRSPGDVHLR